MQVLCIYFYLKMALKSTAFKKNSNSSATKHALYTVLPAHALLSPLRKTKEITLFFNICHYGNILEYIRLK